MNNRDNIILKKIIQYADEIQATIDRFSLTIDKFASDFVVKNAISMCILQIGELVGNLTEDFKTANNSVPWREIKAMRNIAAHNYGEIDVNILWETAIYDVPDLRAYCSSIVAAE
ncbi:MAG: DUF86 domain-containing protein [Candidatus Ornithomonoglobus sp.]